MVRIREKANSGVVFNASGNSDLISSVAVFTGSRRRRLDIIEVLETYGVIDRLS